ncbi:DUF3618 domain-containing protein [Actinotalea sp. BY-33]|uniref:DUF3618 domain-containing protein n=1 Tax=Actinotalea soli TaxID=2819234 RepID=A0A939LPR2_9CELL|nr:DUF3618 domain-containing protein [Actinotalea soli]MBO1751678.1 DUF3618 domain-containing protein [Actinotalea soli]
MSTDPDQIRADIERTRADLSHDVDALEDKVSPSSIAHRKTEQVRGAVGSVKERVMGSAHDAKESVRSKQQESSSPGEVAHGLQSTLREKAEGNPLAAGLIAFGVGWLASSLLPTSKAERDAATQLKEKASEHSDQLKDAASSVVDDLRAPAQEAVSAVQERAREAATTLKEDGADAAQGLRGDATQAKEQVQESRGQG